MEIEEALRTYLLTKTALTALVSTRIFPDDISDGAALPCVVYQKISDVKLHTHDGQNKLEKPMMQYTAKAATKASAKAISKQLKLALCDYKGTLSGITIQYVTLDNELSSLEVNADGAGKTYYEDLEFEICYNKE